MQGVLLMLLSRQAAPEAPLAVIALIGIEPTAALPAALLSSPLLTGRWFDADAAGPA